MRDATPVAVASRSFSRHAVLRAELLERYSRVTFNDGDTVLEAESLIAFLRGHVKAITGLERLDDHVLGAVPELKVVSKYGVGLDTIDAGAMVRHGVRLAWTPGVNRRSVAELAVAFMIALVHRVPEAAALARDGRWQQVRGRQLTGRTVGIVGCGHVGKDVVRLLQPFGCRVLAHDIVEYAEFYREFDVVHRDLPTLLADADLVTLHVPLDASTRGMLDAARLGAMKRGAMLVNTARGGLVDEDALARLLVSGHLAGAALDVFASEPPSLDLIRLPRVIATPHIGGSAEEAVLAMGRAAIAGLDAVEARPPLPAHASTDLSRV